MGFIYQGNTKNTTNTGKTPSFCQPSTVQGEGPGFGRGHCQATSGTSTSGGGGEPCLVRVWGDMDGTKSLEKSELVTGHAKTVNFQDQVCETTRQRSHLETT